LGFKVFKIFLGKWLIFDLENQRVFRVLKVLAWFFGVKNFPGKFSWEILFDFYLKFSKNHTIQNKIQ